MKHLLILPVLVPLLTGCLLLLLARLPVLWQRLVSLSSCGVLLLVSIGLLSEADSGVLQYYALGNWQPPFGIILWSDRLSALLLLLTAALAYWVLIYACRGDDRRGRHFHALFQFQLMGVNGAFLTGDLFNLFVFFEVLLIASYALLVHGGGMRRVRAGLHYLVLNLVGSGLFLIAVGALYGITGTLNMADLAQRVALASPDNVPILKAAGLLLLLVFGLKAAMLPLHFWLPHAYANASAPVAALFAILSKVGVYAIVRVYTLVFGAEAGPLAGLGQEWLWVLAFPTLVVGMLGALAANRLPLLLAYLVIASVGLLLAGISLGTPQALTASLYYLLHSTFIGAAFFLLSDLIARQRGDWGGRLESGPALRNPQLLGGLFFLGAMMVSGLPPWPGFIGKLLLLHVVPQGMAAVWLWSMVLLGGLLAVMTFSRAGTTLFWRLSPAVGVPSVAALDPLRVFACCGLFALDIGLMVFASPILDYLQATAQQLYQMPFYLQILPAGGV
jgi:multicomponent K+:H+ antiporter subunit D